jgi:hypothetical protein
MVKGENRLTLTAIDTPADKQVSLGNIAPGHTGIIYDALQLSQESQGVAPEKHGVDRAGCSYHLLSLRRQGARGDRRRLCRPTSKRAPLAPFAFHSYR